MPTHTKASSMPDVLERHLRLWAGGIPASGVRVVAHASHAQPGWDGNPRRLTGLVDPGGQALIAVVPGAAAEVAAILRRGNGKGWAQRLSQLPALLGRPDHLVERVALRWCVQPPSRCVSPDAGVWVEADSSTLPPWLHPFGGHALVALDGNGHFLAGVGIKQHDHFGRELSVGTEPHARGRGLARRLVAQAARHILSQGRIPTYLHTLDNIASSHVAAAAGFVDRGWFALMLSDTPALTRS